MAAKKKQTLEQSLAGRFVNEANRDGLRGGAIVVTGRDLGVAELGLGFVDGGRATVAGGETGIVVPSDVRRGSGRGGPDAPPFLVLADAATTGDGEWTFTGAEGVVFERPWSVLPDQRWVGEVDGETGEDWTPGAAWLPSGDWLPSDPRNLRVFVPSDLESIADRVGLHPSELREQNGPVTTLATGDTLDRDSLLFAMFSDEPLFPDEPLLPPAGEDDTAALFDAGVPAPMPGMTYGFCVLATPDASVDGQSVNPLASASEAEFLTREATHAVLRRAGITDADEVEWLTEPTAVTGERESGLLDDPTWVRDAPRRSAVLDVEVELTTFVGVVRGVDGPWAVGVDVARASADDHIFVAGVHRRPVGTANATGVLTGAHLAGAREMTIETVRRLQRR